MVVGREAQARHDEEPLSLSVTTWVRFILMYARASIQSHSDSLKRHSRCIVATEVISPLRLAGLTVSFATASSLCMLSVTPTPPFIPCQDGS